MITPPFFPARPVNGGPLTKALPKSGEWTVEAKYNGWRAWVHTPTGTMFNREHEPLTISAEFKSALTKLRETFAGKPGHAFDWLDVEALERRHHIGRGSLIILDAPECAKTCVERKQFLHLVAAIDGGISIHKELNQPIAADTVYLPMAWNMAGALPLWDILKQSNAALKCEFFEGIVAKRNDSLYPKQLRSASQEFPFWMKHRWAF